MSMRLEKNLMQRTGSAIQTVIISVSYKEGKASFLVIWLQMTMLS